jgi:hypothetical protein
MSNEGVLLERCLLGPEKRVHKARISASDLKRLEIDGQRYGVGVLYVTSELVSAESWTKQFLRGFIRGFFDSTRPEN